MSERKGTPRYHFEVSDIDRVENVVTDIGNLLLVLQGRIRIMLPYANSRRRRNREV